MRIASAIRPSGPNAPSKKRASPSETGAPNVAPPSAELIDCSVPRADTIVTAPAAPAPTSAGCASGDALSATIGRGVQDRAPRGQAQNISGSPGLAYGPLYATNAVPAASTATPGASPGPITAACAGAASTTSSTTASSPIAPQSRLVKATDASERAPMRER